MSTLSGYSTIHDAELATFNAVRTIILARQEQQRQDLRRRLGMPERVGEYKPGWLKDFLGWRSREEKFLDGLIEEERRAKRAEEKEGKGDEEVEIKEALEMSVNEKVSSARKEQRKEVLKGMRMSW